MSSGAACDAQLGPHPLTNHRIQGGYEQLSNILSFDDKNARLLS